jgi:hypothetical protein
LLTGGNSTLCDTQPVKFIRYALMNPTGGGVRMLGQPIEHSLSYRAGDSKAARHDDERQMDVNDGDDQ